MRWDDFGRSDNVDDFRGQSGGGGGGGGGFGRGAGGLGIGTVLVLGLVGWAVGIDPRLLISGVEMLQGGGSSYQQEAPRQRPRGQVPTDETGQFISAVLKSTEDRWKEVFDRAGKKYNAPRLAIFDRTLPTGGCGMAQSAMGPFYCPGDRRIYLDTSFFRDISAKFRGCQGKACQFAQAYVIAHEVGHHIQNELNILPRVQQMQRSMDKVQANQLQVRVELQADCFAGLWANLQRQKSDFLEQGDIDAALQTAAAIGDDTLQRRSGGAVVPDSFTHGSAEQRKRWFMNGFTRGSISACNTFDNAAKI